MIGFTFLPSRASSAEEGSFDRLYAVFNRYFAKETGKLLDMATKTIRNFMYFLLGALKPIPRKTLGHLAIVYHGLGYKRRGVKFLSLWVFTG